MRMAEGMEEDEEEKEDVELALVTEAGGGVGRSGRHTSCSSTWESKTSSLFFVHMISSGAT